MNSFDISTCVISYLLNAMKHQYAVPNLMFGSGESDVISITKTGYMHEVEIKISRSDFKADARKSKWKLYKESIKSGRKLSSYYNTPNYFWYCFPEGLIEDSEIDPSFGIFHIKEDPKWKVLTLTVKREASRFGKSKVNRKIINQIARSLSFKLNNQQKSNQEIKRRWEEVKEELELLRGKNDRLS